MNWAFLTEVWTPVSLGVAILEGLAFGYLLGRFGADPAYASPLATPSAVARLTLLSSVSAGLLFYGGQVLATYVVGDPNWLRVASRASVWVVFSIGIALGIYLKLHRHVVEKHSQAHEQAVHEFNDR